MEAYEVITYNINEDKISSHNGYFMHKRHAEDILKGYAQQFEGKDEVLDLDGISDDYQNWNLEILDCYHKPALYYLSHWDNEAMVMYIKKIWIQE